MIRTAVILAWLVALVGLVAPAHADFETSKTLFAAGKRKYSLGEYDRAIELFKQAYEEHPAPAYLYNIGQAYRKAGDCKNALDYFGRFLDSNPEDDARQRVITDISDVEAKCDLGKKTNPEADKTEPEKAGPDQQPDKTEPDPDKTGPTRVADATKTGDAKTGAKAGGADTGITRPIPEPSGPALFVATAEGGISLFDIGDVVLPVSPTLRLFGGYPLELAGIRVEPGASLELQTMAYEHAMGDSTAMFTTFLLGAQAHYPIVDKISAGADLGLGFMRFSSLEAGNPFVTDFAARDGAKTSFALRLGVSGEYQVLPGLSASLAPAFAWASRTDDLREPISSITRIELLVGVRYRR